MIRHLLAIGVSATALASVAARRGAGRSRPRRRRWISAPGASSPSTIDPAVDPGDDFFAYVNGKWVRENPMPAEYSRFGAFDILGEKSTSRREAAGRRSRRRESRRPARPSGASSTLTSPTSTPRRSTPPASPRRSPISTAIKGAARPRRSSPRCSRRPATPALVAAGVTVDSKDPNSYIVSVGFDGMGLPDRDLYLVDNERNLEIQAKYKDFLALHARPGRLRRSGGDGRAGLRVRAQGRRARMGARGAAQPRHHLQQADPRRAARARAASSRSSACCSRRSSRRPSSSSSRSSRRRAEEIAAVRPHARRSRPGSAAALPAMMALLDRDAARHAQGVHGGALPRRPRAGAAQGDRRRAVRLLRHVPAPASRSSGRAGSARSPRPRRSSASSSASSMSRATSRRRARRRWRSWSPTCAGRWPRASPRTTG